ncbi:MAG: hypothetical protein FJ008_08335 [Chloroflexi bacterium]|nr:hypothetical protein [Chloroflexota bacterium]
MSSFALLLTQVRLLRQLFCHIFTLHAHTHVLVLVFGWGRRYNSPSRKGGDMSKHWGPLAAVVCVLLVSPLAACARPSPAPTTPPVLPIETSSDNISESALASKVPRISIEELRQKIEGGDDILLVDARKAEEYAKDRIKGAISVPLDVIIAGEWTPPKDKEVILY